MKVLVQNRRAIRDYTILERFEAGIQLSGSEVKSVREGRASLVSAFAEVEDGEAIVRDLHVKPYEHGCRFSLPPDRPRRLLLHRREIDHLAGRLARKGLTLIPLRLYLKGGWIKMELALCRGKEYADRREELKRRDADREAERAMRAVRRRIAG